MPNLFIDRFNTDGKQYHYVSDIKGETVAACTVVDFGVKDSKGRSVGASRHIQFRVVTLEEGEHSDRNNRLHPVGKPTSYFVGRACSTRNGDRFGSGEIYVEAPTLEGAAAELDKRIERARRLAVKKHTA